MGVFRDAMEQALALRGMAGGSLLATGATCCGPAPRAMSASQTMVTIPNIEIAATVTRRTRGKPPRRTDFGPSLRMLTCSRA